MSLYPEAPTQTLHIEDLPRLAMPVVDFIDTERPDIVIGCDRGARLFSLAVHAMWNETKDERFPTADHKIHFAKVSSDASKRLLAKRINYIIETSRNASVEPMDQPHILFIEDWIHVGETMMTARQAVHASLRRSRISFATMFGDRADVTGQTEELIVPFMDKPDEIGVNYVRHYTAEVAQVAQKVESDQAKENRATIYAACKSLALATRK